jgi:hypothetical protein
VKCRKEVSADPDMTALGKVESIKTVTARDAVDRLAQSWPSGPQPGNRRGAQKSDAGATCCNVSAYAFVRLCMENRPP